MAGLASQFALASLCLNLEDRVNNHTYLPFTWVYKCGDSSHLAAFKLLSYSLTLAHHFLSRTSL